MENSSGRESTVPTPRGELSSAVLAALRGAPGTARLPDATGADPYGEDLQLALLTCYELHYRGMGSADPAWEWDPDLLRFRAALERCFLAALRAETAGGDDVAGELDALLAESADGGVGGYLIRDGDWEQMREYLVHRSVYHLKEAEPHLWVVPRLTGRAKAAMMTVQFDEFGGGRADRMHSLLYADLLAGAGLRTDYLAYLDLVPAPMLAVVNVMSLFGLHRAHRGALLGHFAHIETTSSPGSRRMVDALTRMDADDRCVRFYAEHVVADAVHEQLVRRDVVADALCREPELAESVVLGIQATTLLDDKFGAHVLDAWQNGRGSLRSPLAALV